MCDGAIEGVGPGRADRAAGRVVRAEHEVVDEQLRASVEELRQPLWTVLGLEGVLLLHPHPGQLAALAGEVVAAPRQLFLSLEQCVACSEPFLACSDLVLRHLVASLRWCVVSLTQYYTATTLDGFIADPDNSLDWLFTRAREDDGPLNYGEFIAGVGAMAMGSTTYEWLLDHEFADKDPAEWKWPYDIPCWVFTHRQLPVV